MLVLNIEAPFATFRTFAAGSFRPTAGFLTPSAAYGLVLNLAGVDTRLDDGKSAMTLMREDLPRFPIALGIPSGDSTRLANVPAVRSVYQQLHNYPVGNSGKEHAKNTMGNKYNITPVRRQFLIDLRATVAVDCDDQFAKAVRDGLNGQRANYGLPFLGDNSFLPNKIEPSQERQPTFWYEKLGEENTDGDVRDGVTRLTEWIDRADMSKTVSHLYAPSMEPTVEVPSSAWTTVGPPC